MSVEERDANINNADFNHPDATDAPSASSTSSPAQLSASGVPKKITNAQTVCNERNAKGKPCHGFLKQLHTGGEEAVRHLRGDEALYKCQTCGTLYAGPPLGHVRDPEKQSRYVEKELAAILRAAGGTLPAFPRSQWRGNTENASTKSSDATALSNAAAAIGGVPVAETASERNALLLAARAAKPSPFARHKMKSIGHTQPTAATTSGQDSSTQADAHRPAAEAQAATGFASAAPLSPSAANASPASGAETPADLSPDAPTKSNAADDIE